MKIIDKIKKGAKWIVSGVSAGAVIVVAQFGGGQWIGQNLSGNPMYANPVEGAKVYEVVNIDPVSPVVPRQFLANPIHIPAGCDAYVTISGVDRDSVRHFVAELRYQIPDALHKRYGRVQFNPDFSFQSDR